MKVMILELVLDKKQDSNEARVMRFLNYVKFNVVNS
jgi:hypothetical protein